MTATARRSRSGALVPWVCDWWDGVQEMQRLKAQGLDLDLTPDQAHALGVALAEQREAQGGVGLVQDLTLSPELLQLLDQIAEERAGRVPHGHGQAQDHVHDQDQATAQSWLKSQVRHSGHRFTSGHGDGQVEHHSGTVQRNPGYEPDEQEG